MLIYDSSGGDSYEDVMVIAMVIFVVTVVVIEMVILMGILMVIVSDHQMYATSVTSNLTHAFLPPHNEKGVDRPSET